MADEAPLDGMSFEDAMRELESVVGKLEAGEVPLEESIDLYQRGARLKAHCEARLKAAEEKVAMITQDGDGTPVSATPVDSL
jgi:exodeoxyribonuclease VII small subunit